MGERKVLNKYYPPDFDTIRLPKLPGGRPDQYVIRIMAPFTMRCLTCGNYVYKGRKFNARKEDAKGEKYLGIQIYRFYIRCPECLSEITFKTDPQNSDYAPEHGAIRTFQAERLAELEEQREAEEKEEEEANNPMLVWKLHHVLFLCNDCHTLMHSLMMFQLKALENRTAESRMEMDVLDALEEIRDWNSRNASVKHEQLLEGLIAAEQKESEEEETALTALASKIFEEKRANLRRLADEPDEEAPPTKRVHTERPQASAAKKSKLSGLVVKRKDKSSSREMQQKEETNSSEVRTGSEIADNERGKTVVRSGEAKTGGLGLLCGYSDSSSDTD